MKTNGMTFSASSYMSHSVEARPFDSSMLNDKRQKKSALNVTISVKPAEMVMIGRYM